MGVHVDEIHTDVVPAVAPVEMPREAPPAEGLDHTEHVWRDAQRSVVMRSRRTAAEGFDD